MMGGVPEYDVTLTSAEPTDDATAERLADALPHAAVTWGKGKTSASLTIDAGGLAEAVADALRRWVGAGGPVVARVEIEEARACPAYVIARATGSVGATHRDGEATHVYDRATGTCSVCGEVQP